MSVKRLAYQMSRKRAIEGEGIFRHVKSNSAPILYDQWYEGCGIKWVDGAPFMVNFCEKWLKMGVSRALIVKAFGIGLRKAGVVAKDMGQTHIATGAIKYADEWLRVEVDRINNSRLNRSRKQNVQHSRGRKI